MGHYRAEMMCDDCGNIHCTCVKPAQPDPTANKWIVDGVTPIQIKDFDVKYTSGPYAFGSTMTPLIRRWGRPMFDTQAEAREHARKLSEDNVRATRAAAKIAEDIHARTFGTTVD